MKENKRFNELPFVNDSFLLPEWNVFEEKLLLTILMWRENFFHVGKENSDFIWKFMEINKIF